MFAGSLFPFLFITIACGGAVTDSRAHLLGRHDAEDAGEKEGQMRVIGYGGMMTSALQIAKSWHYSPRRSH